MNIATSLVLTSIGADCRVIRSGEMEGKIRM
jgi:hypothetical protein